MGNSSGSDSEGKKWEEFLKTQYQHSFPSYIHSHFGEISIYANRMNLNQMIFNKKIPASLINEHSKNLFQRRLGIRHNNLLKLFHIDSKPSESFSCGSGSQEPVFGYWEYPGTKTLEDVLNKKPDHMRETLIWLILYKILDACELLESHGLYHGDIRLSNIFITDVDIKLCVRNDSYQIRKEFSLIPGTLNGFQKSLNSHYTYLSPIQMELLVRKDAKITSSNNKNDVFSLGMTLLHLTTKECRVNLTSYSLSSFDLLQFLFRQHFRIKSWSILAASHCFRLLTIARQLNQALS